MSHFAKLDLDILEHDSLEPGFSTSLTIWVIPALYPRKAVNLQGFDESSLGNAFTEKHKLQRQYLLISSLELTHDSRIMIMYENNHATEMRPKCKRMKTKAKQAILMKLSQEQHPAVRRCYKCSDREPIITQNKTFSLP